MRTWVTVDDFVAFTGAEPYTVEDKAAVGACCAAVSGFIARVRPDLLLPETVVVGGKQYSALAGQMDPMRAAADEEATVGWAALQMVKRWWEKRGAGQASSFQELGFVPASIDKDIEVALRIGREARPVIA